MDAYFFQKSQTEYGAHKKNSKMNNIGVMNSNEVIYIRV